MDDSFTSLALTTECTTTADESDPELENSTDDQSVHRIAQQLRKWLEHYPDYIPEQQFTSLVRKCGIMNIPKIVELFRSLDFERTGSVPKEVLLKNNYLASLIMV